jgi:hypothetical protein
MKPEMVEQICQEYALFRYTWPGKSEAFICLTHALKLVNVAEAMGLTLQLIPLSYTERMDGHTCSQVVKAHAPVDHQTQFQIELENAARHLQDAYKLLNETGQDTPHNQVELKKMLSYVRNFAFRTRSSAMIKRNMLK